MKKTAALTAALLLAACSGGGGPDKTSFEKAINRYAAEQGICLPVRLAVQNPQAFGMMAPDAELGAPVIKIASRAPSGEEINRTALAQMKLLDNEGFYKKTDAETLPASGGNGDFKVQVYEITDKGRAQTREHPHGPRFCIGTQKVEKINWYTEPASAEGLTISKVSYQVRFETEKWADKLLRQSEESRPTLQTVRTQTATLVKTNDGWHDIRELH